MHQIVPLICSNFPGPVFSHYFTYTRINRVLARLCLHVLPVPLVRHPSLTTCLL